VSVPIDIRAIPAATAAAEPPELPPGMRSRFHGLREGALIVPAANSCVTVFPTTIPPAASHIATSGALSAAGATSAIERELHFVGMPATSTMSLIASGMPCIGPTACPEARRWSERPASASSSSRGRIITYGWCSCGIAAIRSSTDSINATAVSEPSFIWATASDMVRSCGAVMPARPPSARRSEHPGRQCRR
jgi:hypothetical protein